jgi:hypothetical protein
MQRLNIAAGGLVSFLVHSMGFPSNPPVTNFCLLSFWKYAKDLDFIHSF